MIYLIIGKAGAGKTHYATALTEELQIEGQKAMMIDGDEYRGETDNTDYSDEGRIKNLLGAAKMAADFEDEGYVVVMAFVAPRRLWRGMMRVYWQAIRVIYIPGGDLWENTTYEVPDDDELNLHVQT